MGAEFPRGWGRAPHPGSSPQLLLHHAPPPLPQAHRRSRFGERRSGAGGAAAPPGGSEWGTCRRLAGCSQRFVIISPAFLISKKPLAGFISSCEECCLGRGPGWAASLRVALRVALRASPAPPAPPRPAEGQVQPPQARVVGWEEKGGDRPLGPWTLGPSPAVPGPPALGHTRAQGSG